MTPLGRLTKANNAWAEGELSPTTRWVSCWQRRKRWRPAWASKVFEFKHQYDPLGNRTQTVLPGGRELNHLFYGSGHLHQVNLDGQVVSDFERDALHREVRRSKGRLHSEFAYDRAGRLSVQRVMRGAGGWGAGSGSRRIWKPRLPRRPWARSLRDVQRRFKGVIERHYHYDPSGQLAQWLDRTEA